MRVVVVGAGVGGLSAALSLAPHADVTVVERAAAPGGKVRAVATGGVPVEAGPTVFTMRWVFDELFDAAGADFASAVTLTPARVLARHAWDDARLDLFADPDASADAIAAVAGPAEARGFRAFTAEAKRIHDALEGPFLRGTKTNPLGLTLRMGGGALTINPYQTLWAALGRYFRDPRLQQLFGRYATYAGSSPFLSPATLMLIAHVELAGVWLVDGGLTALARALADAAVRHGARFRYGAQAAAITTAAGRTTGVTLATGEHLAADAVIFNGDPHALAAGRLGPAAARAVTATPAAERSLSALVWTAHASPAGFPLARHNVFFSPDYPAEFAALAAGRLPADPTVYLCAQDRDDAAPGGGPERIQIIVNAPAGYAAQEVEQCQAAMLSRLRSCGLELGARALNRTTPQDFEHLFPSTGGALYGRASHGWAAAFRRPGSRTRIPGLYLAGGATHPGAGVPMAALSGRLAANALMADRASTRPSRPAATRGGISTRSRTTAATG